MAAMVAMLSLTAAPSVVLAEHGTCDEEVQTNRWRGHTTIDATQKHGASGIFESHTLDQCGTPDLVEISGTFMWSAIAPNNNASQSVVAMGMGTCRSATCPAGQRYYSAWGRSSSTSGCSGFANRAPTVADEGAYVAANHDFKVYHSANQWQFYVDTTQVNAIAEGSICWTPSRAQWFGQTKDIGDAMGGDPNDKFSVTSTKYTNSEGGGFVLTNFAPAAACSFNGGVGPYFCDVTGASAIAIWTDR